MWGFVQLLIVTSIVAAGAGLHVVAYLVEGHAHGGLLVAVLSVAVPVTVFLGTVCALSWYLLRRFDRYPLSLS